MEATNGVAKKDTFLQDIMNNAMVTIFFIAGAGVVAAAGSDGSGLGVGIAAAAGCASIAYIAKLVIAARSSAEGRP